ncbi:hypothetical protein SVIOM342S_06675 [Streptomyces violaceorubidus]
MIAVDRLPELRDLRVESDHVEIGAALTLTEIERRLDGSVPLLAQLFPQFASRLIRNGATLGGNLGTGSPIGDSPPVLLALEASLVLADADGEREVPLADFTAGADLNGGAVKNACEQLRERLLRVAASQLGSNASDVRIVEGVARTLGSDRELAWDDLVRTAYFQRVQLSAAGYYRDRGAALGRQELPRVPVQVLRHRRRRDRGGGGRLHRRVPHPAGGHRARRRRQSVPADRHRPGRGRVRAGRGLADAGGPALGHR